MVFGGSPGADLPTVCLAAVDADVFDSTTDPHAFITGYVRAGSAAFNEINADFAVAIWDAHRQGLTCARDPLGVKPLYYTHQQNRFFAFASEIKALLALGEVPVRPNPHTYREYLTWNTAYLAYSTETFYENIYSVLPGHSLHVNDRGLNVQPYWVPKPERFSGLRGAEDHSELFRECFTVAIESRMRGKTSVGAHLSGGLDSSSVSCVAQALLIRQHRPPLHTFHIDVGLASTDETTYVQAVVDRHHPRHHTVRPVADVLDAVLEINRVFDRPEQFIIPSSFHLSVSLEARQAGCDVLLTGHDGDSVIPNGFDFLDELIDAHDWETLREACRHVVSYPERILRSVSDDWPHLPEEAKFQRYVLFLLHARLKKQFGELPLRALFGSLRKPKLALGLRTDAILAYAYRRIRTKLANDVLIDSTLSPDFRQQVARRPAMTTEPLVTHLSGGGQFPVGHVLNTTNVICNEQLNHIGAHYGHSYGFPFFDRHVVDLGLATPQAIHFDYGRGRGLIRHGLRAVLPPAVASRLTKTNFVEYGNQTAKLLYLTTRDQLASPGHAIWGVVDRKIFNKIATTVFDPRLPVARKTRFNWLLSRSIYLALWLDSLRR